MSGVAISIEVTDRATPVVRAYTAALAPEQLKPLVGRSVTTLFQEHLYSANRSRPNALGGTRTNYYATAADRTHFTLLPDGVLISVNQVGMRLHVVGGTVTPIKAKMLTIPASPEAHGKRAGEFGDLIVIFGRGGRPVALARPSGGAKTLNAAGHIVGSTSGEKVQRSDILFWLVDSAMIKPDPSLLPTDAEVFSRIERDLGAYLKIVGDRARGRLGNN